MIIRQATVQDAPQLLPLLDQLGYPQTVESIQDKIHTYSTPDQQIWVAEQDSHIFGLVAIVFTDMFVRNGRRCRIEGLVVNAPFRGQGVGRRLMEHTEALAKTQDCPTIELTSGLRRAPEGTHDFYKILGYSNEGLLAKLYLRKELSLPDYHKETGEFHDPQSHSA